VGSSMRSYARVVVQMLRCSLLLAAVLSPSLDCAKISPPEVDRRHPNLIPRQGVGALGVLRRGRIFPRLRGNELCLESLCVLVRERVVSRKPVRAVLEESQEMPPNSEGDGVDDIGIGRRIGTLSTASNTTRAEIRFLWGRTGRSKIKRLKEQARDGNCSIRFDAGSGVNVIEGTIQDVVDFYAVEVKIFMKMGGGARTGRFSAPSSTASTAGPRTASAAGTIMPSGAARQPRAPEENYGIIPWTKVGGKFHFLAQVILCKFPISPQYLSAKAGHLDSPLFSFPASPLHTIPLPVRSWPECAQVSYSTDQYDIKIDSLRGKPESNFLNPLDLGPQARNLRIAAVPRFPGHLLDVFEFVLNGVPQPSTLNPQPSTLNP